MPDPDKIGMMKARIAYADAFGNPAGKRMTSPNPMSYDFGDGTTGTHFMGSVDNYAVPKLQEENGKLNFKDYSSNSKEAMRFENNEDADYFAKYYKDVAPMSRKAYGGQLPQHANGAVLQGIGKGLQAVSPFVSMIPGVGTAVGMGASIAGKGLETLGDNKERKALEKDIPPFMQPQVPQNTPASMYANAQQQQQGLGTSMQGYNPTSMPYGEMYNNGGGLPSFNHGGTHPDDFKGRKPISQRYYASRGSFSNTPEGVTTMESNYKPIDVDQEGYLELANLRKQLIASQDPLKKYYGEQGYNQQQGIPVDMVNKLSPEYYGLIKQYNDALKAQGIDRMNLAGNIEGNQIPYDQQAFGFRHNSYSPNLNYADVYGDANYNTAEYDPKAVDAGAKRVIGQNEDGSPIYESVGTEQNTLLRNEEIPSKYNPENMMFWGDQGGLGIKQDESGRSYIASGEGDTMKNLGWIDEYAQGGPLNGQHPQAEFEVEKDEIIYHPNDKPVSLANGGLNQVANDYSKVTGNKHSHPNGGPQMAGGKEGYVYSDQLKVPKDLMNALKDLI